MELVGNVLHERAMSACLAVLTGYQAVQFPYGGDVETAPVAGDIPEVGIEQQASGHLFRIA